MSQDVSRDSGTKRLFRCGSCRHKMRFGASRCGACWEPTPIYNHASVLVGAPMIALIAGLVTALLIV